MNSSRSRKLSRHGGSYMLSIPPDILSLSCIDTTARLLVSSPLPGVLLATTMISAPILPVSGDPLSNFQAIVQHHIERIVACCGPLHVPDIQSCTICRRMSSCNELHSICLCSNCLRNLAVLATMSSTHIRQLELKKPDQLVSESFPL